MKEWVSLKNRSLHHRTQEIATWHDSLFQTLKKIVKYNTISQRYWTEHSTVSSLLQTWTRISFFCFYRKMFLDWHTSLFMLLKASTKVAVLNTY